jgi:hypothetical protein
MQLNKVDLKCIKWSFILDKDKKAGSKDEILGRRD